MTKQEAAQKLAELQLSKDALESEKKAVASDYTEQIKKIESEMSALARMYLSEENKDQADMFDGIEESQVEPITDESKPLNSGLELPEPTDTYLKEVDQEILRFGLDEFGDLENNQDVRAFKVINSASDLELMGILDYDSEQLKNAKGKLLICFEDESSLQSFIHGFLLEKNKLYERFSNYILIAPVEQNQEEE